ncbi:hypothetical protein [Jeongeupia chitinilytica]|uniref:HTH Mu-type domain-containing protein n=1 Tax=Jeongeupia chitinilytica TaxID=1041641 RepID=A0ABQ3H2Z1_9NEIS|nr:hypothetical protein [Jeongeupia chitinilytica]GHD63734.1 hypothetical protein GCM10007350_21810 [Jeongeupia chitinilytica]
MSKSLYTAAEIAAMGLAGLPGTKKAILTRADREGWYVEERVGFGGTRKMFEIPAKYLSATAQGTSEEVTTAAPSPAVAGAIGPGGQLDAELLDAAQQVADWFYAANPGRYKEEMKGDLVMILYRYALKHRWHGKLNGDQIKELLQLIA